MELITVNEIARQEFWPDALAGLVRTACDVLRLAGKRVNNLNISDFIQSLPRKESDADDPVWQNSYCGKCLHALAKRVAEESEERSRALDAAAFIMHFALREKRVQHALIESVCVVLANSVTGKMKKGAPNGRA